ncbi:MAG: porin family protein [Bacteroidetes bacterium]|nr:porin family protein [Bacteroidota bacterium]
MRKYLLILIFCLSAFTSFGQAEIGIKFSPSISANRVNTDSDSLTYSNDGTGLRFVFGVILDLPLTEKYYFSTGLLYSPERAAIVLDNLDQQEAYKTQYLQIPITVKLFTEELFLDTKLFFQIGLVGEIKVTDKEEDVSNELVESFRAVDTSLTLGAGFERNFGVANVWFAGFSYSRGLVNIVSDSNSNFDDFSIKNDMYQIDLGIKF